jgi:hypothetical protein
MSLSKCLKGKHHITPLAKIKIKGGGECVPAKLQWGTPNGKCVLNRDKEPLQCHGKLVQCIYYF